MITVQQVRRIRTATSRTIAKVAAQGVAFMRSDQSSGLEAISYPVFNLRGRAMAALTVPYVKRLDVPGPTSPADAQAALAPAVSDLNAALGGSIGKATGPEHEKASSPRRARAGVTGGRALAAPGAQREHRSGASRRLKPLNC